jgi:CAP12/Pycsar effector protein, TIR domain
MPPGILYGVGPNSPVPPSGSQEIGLTVAGIAACPGTDEILSSFIEFIQRVARFEKTWQPPTENPDAIPTFGRGNLAWPRTDQIEAMRILPLIIKTEQMGWGSISPSANGDWSVSVTREIRHFRNVANIDGYWSQRSKPWESRAASSRSYAGEIVTPSFGSSSASGSSDVPIFIVHGTDTVRAEAVAYAVSNATGRKTIILREQPNLGRTLIEKFEQHAAEVSYAIILLTPDDKGGRANDLGSQPRGRQNVVFEMGYFYGLIGRANVSVLLSPGVEKPSDMDGIAYITLDDHGAWKEKLFRELKHVGIDTSA